jgi:hypothetical protein
MRCGSCHAGDQFLEEVDEGREFYCRGCSTYQTLAETIGEPLPDDPEVDTLLASVLDGEPAWSEEPDPDALEREAQAAGVVRAWHSEAWAGVL